MGEAETGSSFKQTLKNLCCSNGWSYGVFWLFDQRNSMLLTMEDAYYEQQIGPLVDNMLLKFHILGQGIIGQAAFTGKHQWIFSDSIGNEPELQDQLSYGIKTIAVISVGRWGVVQFGSTQKISERMEFLAETEKLFYDVGSCHGPTPLEIETCNLDGLFATLTSGGNFCNENPTTEQGGCSREPTGWSRSLQHLTEPSCFAHEIQIQSMNSDMISRINDLAANTPCTSSRNSKGSILTSFEKSFPVERGGWDPSVELPQTANGLAFTSLYSTCELVDEELHTLDSFGKTEQKRHSFGANAGLLDSVITLQRSPEEFNLLDFTTDLSSSFTLEDLSQWISPSPQHHIHGVGATKTRDPSCSAGVTSVPSVLIGGDAIIDIPARLEANSSQSSITDAFISNVEKSTTVHDNGNDMFNGTEMDYGLRKAGVTSGMSSPISELDVHSMTGKRKGLFSELGLEELLGGVSNSSCVTKSTVENPLSTTKRRKIESSSSNFQRGELEGLSCSGGSINLLQHSHTCDKSDDTIFNNEVHQKSQVGLWIDDCYSVNAENIVVATPKKPAKKRSKPGESTRPRPKDRQLIQDRIKELRGIIPHSGKLSIDHLLERTIKYMLFLQGVTKHADVIEQADEPKFIGYENGKLQKHGTMSSGATWAFEVGDQSIPIVVKDLNLPGQMLIEMLCEDRGFFLEIADVIRGFPLSILKGVMELQDDKIWARFIVEADKHVERTCIIWSLLPLLQQKDISEIDSETQPSGDWMAGFPY